MDGLGGAWGYWLNRLCSRVFKEELMCCQEASLLGWLGRPGHGALQHSFPCLCLLCYLTVIYTWKYGLSVPGYCVGVLRKGSKHSWGWAVTEKWWQYSLCWALCFAGSRDFPALLEELPRAPSDRICYSITLEVIAPGWLPLTLWPWRAHFTLRFWCSSIFVRYGKMLFITFCLFGDCDELDL